MATNESECKQAILACLASIPSGQVCSYGKIASLAGHPGKARYVAYILKQLPKDSRIPWHRIINAQGKCSFPIGSDKFLEQTSLLETEGVPMPLSSTSMCQY
ncbi:hypothetical protein A3743_26100, partial [Oleiphilus sp. HI0072]